MDKKIDKVYAVIAKYDGVIKTIHLYENEKDAKKEFAFIKQVDNKVSENPATITVQCDMPTFYREYEYEWRSRTDGEPFKWLKNDKFSVYIEEMDINDSY